MGSPFVGEVRLFAGNFAPVGWMFCDGSILPISEYEVLFQLIGTTYGGDGQSTFALPDLRSRVPVHIGQGAGLSPYVLGQAGGTETVTLTTNQIPAHGHAINANSSHGTSTSPTGKVWAGTADFQQYAVERTGNMAASAIGNSGGSQPHDNRPPFLAVNFIISLFGIFPTQN